MKKLALLMAVIMMAGMSAAVVGQPDDPGQDAQITDTPAENATDQPQPDRGLADLPSQASDKAKNVISSITGIFQSEEGGGIGAMLGNILGGEEVDQPQPEDEPEEEEE